MQNNTLHPRKSLLNEHNKDIEKNQIDIVFNSFLKRPQTMKEVEVTTGIDRANICWFIREYRKEKKVAVIKTVYCPITKHKAGQITTDPKLFPKGSNQLTLF